MGLSNSPKEVLTTAQVILELATVLKEITSNPKVFEKLAKDAYGLPEAEIAKAEEARASISEYTALVAKKEKLEAELIAQQDNIDLRVGELEVAAEKRKEADKKLVERRAEILKREKELDIIDKAQSTRETALNAREAKLTADIAALATERADFEAAKEASKQRAEEIKRLSEGL